MSRPAIGLMLEGAMITGIVAAFWLSSAAVGRTMPQPNESVRSAQSLKSVSARGLNNWPWLNCVSCGGSTSEALVLAQPQTIRTEFFAPTQSRLLPTLSVNQTPRGFYPGTIQADPRDIFGVGPLPNSLKVIDVSVP
jgi:hypothetical protein